MAIPCSVSHFFCLGQAFPSILTSEGSVTSVADLPHLLVLVSDRFMSPVVSQGISFFLFLLVCLARPWHAGIVTGQTSLLHPLQQQAQWLMHSGWHMLTVGISGIAGPPRFPCSRMCCSCLFPCLPPPCLLGPTTSSPSALGGITPRPYCILK